MISLIVWLLVLSSGGFLAAVVWNRKYEEVLPITGSIIIVLLFGFGLVGQLQMGSYIVLGLAVGLYIVALVFLFWQKNIRRSVHNIVTPAFVIFMLFTVIVCYCNYGKLAYEWDEFSHWMDIVKVVTTLDFFGTHPDSNSIFPSYPPGMVLFQYFFQKINAYCGGVEFSEWRAYIAYQIFFAMYFIPFLKEAEWKDFARILLSTVVLFVCPVFLFQDLYTSIYIDPILGILMGSGLARVLLEQRKDVLYDLHIVLTSVMLVLMKDAGLLFSIFLGVFYWLDRCFCRKETLSTQNMLKNIGCYGIGTFGSIAVTKLLWSQHLKMMKIRGNFSTPYNAGVIWNAICGRDDTYRSKTWDNFWEAYIATKKIEITCFEVEVGHSIWTIALILMLIILVLYHVKKGYSTKTGSLLVLTVCSLLVVYILGLCITYMTKFSEGEALRLASFSRYMDIGYLAVWLVIVVLGVNAISKYLYGRKIFSILLLGGILCIMPLQELKDFVTREEVEYSRSVYEPYEEMISKVQTHCNPGESVYFIAQETNGYERLLMCYSVRPVLSNQYVPASIGIPFYDGDSFTREISPEEWQQELLAGYDYVGVYLTNDYFCDVYGVLFENPDEIANNELYRMNKDTGLLEKCE